MLTAEEKADLNEIAQKMEKLRLVLQNYNLSSEDIIELNKCLERCLYLFKKTTNGILEGGY